MNRFELMRVAYKAAIAIYFKNPESELMLGVCYHLEYALLFACGRDEEDYYILRAKVMRDEFNRQNTKEAN